MNRKTIKGSPEILAEVTKNMGPSSCQGYFSARGILDVSFDPETLLKLPYHDFHDNNSSANAKKNLLGKGFKLSMDPRNPKEMEAFYKGTILTQRVTIAQGFFVYSAAIVNMYLTIALISRNLDCPATLDACLEAAKSLGHEQIYNELIACNVSLEICARLHYEGKGSLGGYDPKVWLLWGRLRGIGCPTDQDLLSDEDAIKASISYQEMTWKDSVFYFKKWYKEAYASEFTSLESPIMDRALTLIHSYYEMVQIYAKYERGLVRINEILDIENPFMQGLHLRAILAGIFRRTSKGLTEGKFIEYLDANHLSSSIDHEDEEGEFPILERFKEWFSDNEGVLTDFGFTLLCSAEVSNARVALIHQANRHNQNDQVNQQNRALGFMTRPTKRLAIE